MNVSNHLPHSCLSSKYVLHVCWAVLNGSLLLLQAGETLLIVAARSNNVAAAKALALDAEVVDETDNVCLTSFRLQLTPLSVHVQEEWSALLNAAHKGHTEVVKILLENGASVDQPDYVSYCFKCYLTWYVFRQILSSCGFSQDGLPLCGPFTNVIQTLLTCF